MYTSWKSNKALKFVYYQILPEFRINHIEVRGLSKMGGNGNSNSNTISFRNGTSENSGYQRNILQIDMPIISNLKNLTLIIN